MYSGKKKITHKNLYRLNVEQEISMGQKDICDGNFCTHEQAKEYMKKWLH
jgi:hypothetical protein